MFFTKRKVPIVLQFESSECGLACLAMIANYYGKPTTLSMLRQRYHSSVRGTSMAGLIKTASAIGLNSRPLKAGLDGLQKLSLPCILHWGFNHYVVLTKVTRKNLLIHDPSIGAKVISIQEASNLFTGIALEVSAISKEQTSAHDTPNLSAKDLTFGVSGFNKAVCQIGLLAFMLEGFVMLSPFFLKITFDQVLSSHNLDFLNLLALAFGFVLLFQALCAAARAYSISSVGVKLNSVWVDAAFRHMMQLPMSWFERRYVGDIVSKFNSVKVIQDAMTNQFVSSLLDGVLSIFTAVLLYALSPKLALISAISILLYIVTRALIFGATSRANRLYVSDYNKQYGNLVEAVRGSMSLKVNNGVSIRSARFNNLVVNTGNRELALKTLTTLFSAYQDFIFGAAKIACIWLSARMVIAGEISVGYMILIVVYSDILSARSANFINGIVEIKLLKIHLDQVSDIFSAQPESTTQRLSLDNNLPKEITVNNLKYRYSADDPWILNGISFRINAGESVAITGASGSGKTTLAKILVGLIHDYEGEVLYGDISIKTLGLDNYRELIGAVMQDDQLFAGSISDNISMFSDQADFSEISSAAELADIDSAIHQMPSGYFTPIGDMGTSLSGGQKQKLILARAIFRKPTVLVLDEATSHLDIDSEKIVSTNIARLNITRIIIAHRPETIFSASRVIKLADGIIVAG
ncbi:peptidase domain-containing ABC transporter [Pseudomonas syringae]|uniref:peptidase domain-containing ABC transporter n=1 Tax=Pseudomonas syringae TaxID=317 RepID=UPI000CDB7A78|nr:peptidase domain-containing ABC transporter [Pseudomonas syringae]POP63751.1 ABC transporter [Pseudomonas syringae]